MDNRVALTVRVTKAWWLDPYLWLLRSFCFTFGTVPDWEILSKIVKRGIRVRVDCDQTRVRG